MQQDIKFARNCLFPENVYAGIKIVIEQRILWFTLTSLGHCEECLHCGRQATTEQFQNEIATPAHRKNGNTRQSMTDVLY
jgi:hypothetical protein